MIYKIFLTLSVIGLFLAIYLQGNVLKSTLYVAFFLGFVLRNKYEQWRKWLDMILILLFSLLFYMDWFL